MLPAAQAYSDGTMVKWDEPEVAGQPEPKHPAPSFITTAPPEEHGEAPTVETAATSAHSPASTRDTAVAGAAWAGLGAGLLGLATGVTALMCQAERPQKSNAV